MNDQGENIVFLARELLNAGVEVDDAPIQKKTMTVSMTLKTLCFTTFLAAAGGGLISTIVHEQDRPLSKYERVELKALVFYAARLKGINEELVRLDVEKHIIDTTFDSMTAKDFPVVRRYLQEKVQ